MLTPQKRIIIEMIHLICEGIMVYSTIAINTITEPILIHRLLRISQLIVVMDSLRVSLNKKIMPLKIVNPNIILTVLDVELYIYAAMSQSKAITHKGMALRLFLVLACL